MKRRKLLETTQQGSVKHHESLQSILTEPREILFLIPWDLTRPFFSKLCWECELLIGEIPGVRPIFRCLHRDPDDELELDASLVLTRELRWTPSERLIAVVVAPTGDAGLEQSIAEFCGENKVQPIALSLPFHSPELFERCGFPNPPVVWADGTESCKQLGTLAAARYLRRPERENELKLLLVPGRKGRKDSDQRLSAFVNGVKKHLRKKQSDHKVMLRIQHIDFCEWRRNDARRCVGAFFEGHGIPHIIFAANDHMCLGARDALDDYSQDHNRRVEAGSVELYGFDRIEDMIQRLGDVDEPYIRGTVGQKVSQIANSLRGIVLKILNHQTVMTPIPAATEIKTWIRFDDPVPTLAVVVPPYREEEAHLWITEKLAKELTGVKSLRSKRTDPRYHGANKPVQGKHKRKNVRDGDDEWCIDEDGRLSRKVRGKGWLYVERTLTPMKTPQDET